MRAALDIDIKDFRAFEKKLGKTPKALTKANVDALNNAAFKARQIIQQHIKDKMVNRNQFTSKSIRVLMARTSQINRAFSVVGSIAQYMEEQEFGGSKNKKGKHGVAIPTAEASGEGDTAYPRKKLPRAANQMRKISFSRNGVFRLGGKTYKTKSKKQELFLKVKAAVQSKEKFAFLDMGAGRPKARGIYKIGGRVDKRGHMRSASVRMLYNVSRGSVRIPRRATFDPALVVVERMMPGMYMRAMEKELDRIGLFSMAAAASGN